MTMNFKLEVDNFDKALSQMAENKKATLEALGQAGKGYVKSVTPVGQYDDGRVGGNLRNSINHGVSEDEVQIGTDVHYAGYVHDGTRKMDAQPYIRDGIMLNKDSLNFIAQQIYKRNN